MESWSMVGLIRTKTGVFHVTIRITQSRQLTSCLPLFIYVTGTIVDLL